ncbi:response regulator [Terrimonas sp. NA20]|uniref:Response regulator n=1 Tax=Terrimonas ginsenosidimutans TaxID=2908004 RepID=A0ABS9KUX5_9BACT|nr:response regulator [Terrimonas ginsenosidimutans]MCG2616152.1 response regulator [Terrimonas ginsenosidimutans]
MKKKTVLICDDDPGILEVLDLMIGRHYKTIAEPDSSKVLQLILTHSPDLLLVDLWMPVLPGDQLTRLIRKEEAGKKIKIVAISANTDGSAVALSAGADSFIPKPFEMHELMNELSRLIDEA